MHRSTQFLIAALVAGAAFAGGVIAAGLTEATTVTTTDGEPIAVPSTEAGPTAGDVVTYPTTSVPVTSVPATTMAPQPEPEPVGRHEQLTMQLVAALNEGDLAQLQALASADPRADEQMLMFLIEAGPYRFEECFTVSGGVPQCNATSEAVGMTVGFTDDDAAIDQIGWAFNSGI